MKKFPIRDVCKFLGVKPYVLRYWEQEITLVSPKKDKGGRRQYTWSDLEVLFRLRYLLYEKRYTIAGARNQIWREFTGEDQNQRATLMSLRSELLRLLQKSRAVREELEVACLAPSGAPRGAPREDGESG